MVHLSNIVHVTRITLRARDAAQVGAGPDPYGPIITDFRATMTRMKCASSERLLRLGISMAQLNILFTLQREGEMTMSRLADVLNVSLSNATGLIDRIEERGFVERTRVPEDRRVVLIRVTPAGTRMLEEVDALSDDLLRGVLARLGRAQLAGVAQAVADLRVALDEALGGRHPDRRAHRHTASITTPRSSATLPAEGPATVARPSAHASTPARKD
jgi:DNA-binding MarR family transcriptional regulator